MKAYELATITQQAIAKHNNEGPSRLFAELLKRMKGQAEAGYDHLDFSFSDSPKIVEGALDKLREEGYGISKREMGIIRISWEKTEQQCAFDIAWVGRCKEPADKTGFCAEHRTRKCTCGKQAVRECEATIGAFVCGHLTCGKCRHQH